MSIRTSNRNRDFGQQNVRGFTLIELLVVISIIGMLSSVTMALLSTSRNQAKYSVVLHGFSQIPAAVELYYQDNDGFGPEFEADKCPVDGDSMFADPHIKPIIDSIKKNKFENFDVGCAHYDPELFFDESWAMIFGWYSDDEDNETGFDTYCIDNKGYKNSGSWRVQFTTLSGTTYGMVECVPNP